MEVLVIIISFAVLFGITFVIVFAKRNDDWHDGFVGRTRQRQSVAMRVYLQYDTYRCFSGIRTC